MAIHKHDIELNEETTLSLIINKFSSHADKVKFALFATKECFHLHNETSNKSLATECIQLVESWLVNPKSVTQQQLLDVGNAAYDIYSAIYDDTHVHMFGAYAYVVYAIISDDTSTSASTCSAVYSAVNSFFYNNNNGLTILQQKLTQYTNYAYSLLRSSSVIPTHTKGTITDKSTLMALLDELSELNENLILHKNNKVVLNHPANFATNTLPELVDAIWNDSSLLHYLEHLYDHSKR